MRIVAGLLLVLALLPPAGSATADPARWAWPVPPPHPVLRGFEAPATVWAAGHRGVDVPAAVGDEVRAPEAGVVAFAGRVVDRSVVSVDHAGARSSLEPVDPVVTEGEAVARGDLLGHVGTGGGHAAGVLHLGARVRVADGWAYVNPLLFLGGAEHAVLLPLSAFPG